ncbi:MAG: hypothetical protein IT267_02525 [Saprospiraceae bacterium]|nr:hypothetical protein [Saprospiraceae bacterium]
MKTKIFILGLIVIMVSSCISKKYLPTSKKIDVNEYGSFIIIRYKKTSRTSGELIAVDSSTIVVLAEKTKKCMSVFVRDVDYFSLRFANPRNYGWTIPIYIILPFIHGSFSVLTIPIHLITTISLTATGESSVIYTNKEISYEKLRMFARFPQGIPQEIDQTSIK